MSMVLPKAAPDTARRSARVRSSLRRASRRAAASGGCGACPSESSRSARVDRATLDGSHDSDTTERPRSRRASPTPGTLCTALSTSHRQAAQCTPSRYSSQVCTPPARGCTKRSVNDGVSKSA